MAHTRSEAHNHEAVRNSLSVLPLTKQTDTQNLLAKLDGFIRHCVRTAFRLTKDTNRSFFYTACRYGGLGLTCLAEESDVQTVVQCFKMLNNPDENIKVMFAQRLIRLAKRAGSNSTLEDGQIITEYLNREGNASSSSNSGRSFDIAHRTRRALNRLKLSFHRLDDIGDTQEWSHVGIPKGGKFDFSLQISKRQGCEELIHPSARGQITKVIHNRVTHRHYLKWREKTAQGRVLKAVSSHKESSHWVTHPCTYHPGTMNFALRARLGLLPTLSVISRYHPNNNNFNDRCRGCGQGAETFAHIVSMCPAGMSLVTDRHNDVQNTFVSFIDTSKFTNIRTDRAYHTVKDLPGYNLRPDIVFEDMLGQTYVVEVAVVFERNPEDIGTMENYKGNKYNELMEIIRQTTGKAVRYKSLVVGALGALSNRNEECLSLIGVPRNLHGQLMKKLVDAAIKETHKIWAAFKSKYIKKGGYPTRSRYPNP